MTIPPTITALCVAALVLTGCASSGTNSVPGDDSAPAEAESPADGAGICEILAPDDVEGALGGDFGTGTPRTGEVTVNGVEWTTTGCGWESDEMEVAASIALAEDFAAGYECVEPSSLAGEVTPLDDLGDLAWWTWDDFQGGTGTVIVCHNDTRVEVAVEGPREGAAIDEATTRDGAASLASRILASVG